MVRPWRVVVAVVVVWTTRFSTALGLVASPPPSPCRLRPRWSASHRHSGYDFGNGGGGVAGSRSAWTARNLHTTATTRPPRSVVSRWNVSRQHNNNNNNSNSGFDDGRTNDIRLDSLWRWVPQRREKHGHVQSSNGGSMDAKSNNEATAWTVPSYRTLLVFWAGTVAIWLSEPMLSLVDTTVVGLSSSSSSSIYHLAAMGPATVLTDLSLYATYFLALATTSQLAAAHSAGDWKQCQRITSQVLGVALLTGMVVTLALWCGGPTVLRYMIGSSSSLQHAQTNLLLTTLASQYCSIRAIAAPAAVVGMVAQAVCLATVDVQTPVLAVLLASIINVTGDLWLRHYQLVGVASATAVSSLASCTVLLWAVIRKMNHWNNLQQQQQQSQIIVDTAAAASAISTMKADAPASILSRSMPELYGHDNAIPFNSSLEAALAFPASTMTYPRLLNNATVNEDGNISTPSEQEEQQSTATAAVVSYVSLPDRRELWKLVQLSLPLAFNMWAKMGCYFALTVKAADFGPTAMASHNILMRVFFFFGCFADSLGQTAQSFLPATLVPVWRPQVFHSILRRIAVLAIGVAAFNFGTSRLLLSHWSRLFTSDIGILTCLRETSIWTALALALHPIVVTISGTVIATRNFSNLVKVYAVTVLVHWAVLTRATSFAQTWQALVIFQLVRLINYLFWSKVTPRRLQKHRQDV